MFGNYDVHTKQWTTIPQQELTEEEINELLNSEAPVVEEFEEHTLTTEERIAELESALEALLNGETE